jgi:hypothetical protein
MTKFIFFSTSFLLAFQFVYAQQDFRDGFIVTSQRDTTFLQIDYRSQARNYEACRTKDGSGMKEYGPKELLGYGFVNDKYFESGIIDGSFVEVLVRGELSLYRYGASFYTKKDEKLYHLEQKMRRTGSGATSNVRADTKWKGLLAFMISDCIGGFGELKRLKFDERPITNLVIQYNTCRQSPFTVYKATKPWTKVEMGIAIGMTRSTLVVNNGSYNIPHLNDKYQSLNPSIGLIAAISSPRVSEKFAFQPEVHVSQANYSSTRLGWYQPYLVYDDADINVTTVSIPLLLRYSFPERKYSAQLTLGVNLDSHIRSDARLVRETVADGVVNTAEADAFEINKNQLGYLAGFGVMRSFPKFKAGLLLRYARMGGFSGSFGLPIQNKKLSMSVIIQMK